MKKPEKISIPIYFYLFQKSKSKSVLGLSVYKINMRNLQGFFCPWPSPSPPTLYCEGGQMLPICQYLWLVTEDRMAKGRKDPCWSTMCTYNCL